VSPFSFFRREAILPSLCIDLRIAQEGEFFSRFDISHVLHVSLGENDINLLQRSILSLWVEEAAVCQYASSSFIHNNDSLDWEKEGEINGRKEKIGAPANVAHHNGSSHDDGEVPVVCQLVIL
jgi:hypothetical protein